MVPPPPNGLRGDMYSITTTSSGFHRRNSGAWTTTIPSSTSTITCTQSPLTPSTVSPVWKRRRPSTNYRLPVSHDRTSRSRSFFSKYDRRWRWWHVLFALMILLGVIQFIGVFVSSHLLHSKTASIRIALREFPKMPYQHLDEITTTTSLVQGTTVYHVTKEFGVASMGGMGMIVTALAAAQQRSGTVNAAVVMPFYSYIKKKYKVDRVTDLVVDIRDNEGRLVPVEFRVWKMMHVFNPPPPPLEPNITISATTLEDGTTVNNTLVDGVMVNVTYDEALEQYRQQQLEMQVPIPASEQVPVYLIGPGNRKPFNKAFRASKVQNIYSTPRDLPMEWKDQYFTKAAAEFLAHQAAAADETPLFAPTQMASRHVDVIHIHGATNAYTALYMRDFERRNQLGARTPAIVYTMHDYLDELQYSIRYANAARFFNDISDDTDALKPYTRDQRTFMSSLGIDYADVVTFVSRQMAKDIVEGRDDFYLKEFVMDGILRKAEQKRFFGITNGVDYGALDPFSNKVLIQRRAVFSEYALDMLKSHQNTSAAQQDESTAVWHLSTNNKDFVLYAKDQAKKYLIRRKVLSEADLTRPVVLFVGRFQYNKGLETFEEAARHFVDNDMKFVVIGQPNNYPLKWIKALQDKYPDNVVVFSSASQQRRWLTLCRAAADFMYVPSVTESFGLVAAEGLLFGTPVISTGAGGLKEFLIDRPFAMQQQERDIRVMRDRSTNAPIIISREQYNAYLFDVNSPDRSLEEAISDAAYDYQRNKVSKIRREEFLLRMISSAFALGWDRGNQQGPIYDYNRVYQLALADRHIPYLSKHEIDEERVLLRRLHSSNNT
ncbi:hypothetical protein LRAMOSA08711 [Lichtheimia ramosa]|uniref:Uncharacterized protein n=1 Tax=Lichtheimia ramosa TaxID=688394 RepID=A0A077WGJ1_9FUNG|nr:hypothetical protein LRAMOSA08711 [Lichtheimia ramosa]